jgi:tRNA dimethylallyltransferase
VRVVAVVGPTAAGKTAAAIRLADAVGAEILSCDSVAVYRGLDVGAAKPGPADRARVPHHLLDVAEPDERFSAARWASLADVAAADIHARGRAVIVAGGTGLYLRAWLAGLCPTPPPDPAIRARHAALPLCELRARLERVDPVCAARVASTDRIRTSRALEVWEQTGVPLSELQRRHVGPPRVEALLLGLRPPRAELYARIDARVEAMFRAGLLDEVRGLRERFGDAAPALASVGYAQLCTHLRGEISLGEAVHLIQRDSRRLARRQLTWLGRERQVLWYPYAVDLPLGQAARFLARSAQGAGTHGNRDG